MLLNRLGCKSKLLPAILPLFPQRIVTFVDVFAGSLSVSVVMLDRAKYVIANDIDSDVSNLYAVWRERPQELTDALSVVPYHPSVLKATQNATDGDPVWKAVAFIYRSNFSFLGKGDTLKIGASHNRQIALAAIRDGFKAINRVQFLSCDFRDALNKIAWRHERDREQAFCYCDPPYCDTSHDGYGMTAAWTRQDTADLFDVLTASGLRFALSEFDTPFIRELAARHDLHVTTLGERRNIGNRRTEILVTSYNPSPAQPSLFLPSTNAQVAAGRVECVGACG